VDQGSVAFAGIGHGPAFAGGCDLVKAELGISDKRKDSGGEIGMGELAGDEEAELDLGAADELQARSDVLVEVLAAGRVEAEEEGARLNVVVANSRLVLGRGTAGEGASDLFGSPGVVGIVGLGAKRERQGVRHVVRLGSSVGVDTHRSIAVEGVVLLGHEGTVDGNLMVVLSEAVELRVHVEP